MGAMIIRASCSTSPCRSPTLLPHSPGPYIALMLIGFAIGILGHLTRRPLAGRRRRDPDLPRRPLFPLAARPT